MSKKYAHIDENNIIKGWFDDEVHDSIPEPNIEVTEQQWQKATENNHNYCGSDGVTKNIDVGITKEQQLRVAQAYLSETDWYVIREADSGKEMPSEIKTKRAEARETISDLEE
tara:strand:+ start:2244 stop:2582 length:339 start_codon:yes stop_codon:yes gene_type:complete